jgi:hypothetical protein
MLKGNAPAPGRRFDPNAKRRADYSEKKKKELAARAVKRERKRKPYAVGTVFRSSPSFGGLHPSARTGSCAVGYRSR